MGKGLADVAPLGFWGFATLMWAVGLINTGVSIPDDKYLFPAMLMFGGFGQLLPGLVDIFRGEMFGSVVFSAFGIFWITEGLWVWPHGVDYVGAYDPDHVKKTVGMYRIAWCIIILGITIGSTILSRGHVILLSMLEICIILLTAAAFTGNSSVLRTAGICQIVTAVIAYYCGFAVFFKNLNLYHFPMGWMKPREDILQEVDKDV